MRKIKDKILQGTTYASTTLVVLFLVAIIMKRLILSMQKRKVICFITKIKKMCSILLTGG